MFVEDCKRYSTAKVTHPATVRTTGVQVGSMNSNIFPYVAQYKHDSKTNTSTKHVLEFTCTIKKVVSHEETTLFLTTNGDVYGMGVNEYSQLGLPEDHYDHPVQLDVKDAVDIAVRHKILILRKDNVLFGCGRNRNSALGIQAKDYNDIITKLTEIPSTVYDNEKILFVATAHSFCIIVTENSKLLLTGQK